MFPGFITKFKDKEDKYHVYFYPGVDDYGNHIYGNLEITSNIEYIKNEKNDKAVDYIFLKPITNIRCNLVSNNINFSNKEIFI